MNEMVFCDSCDICVHQACYGIQNIPAGSWLCHPCRKGFKNCICVLCNHSGGAVKKTKWVVLGYRWSWSLCDGHPWSVDADESCYLYSFRNGKGWVHVSCALWIPEVGFGNVSRMEPITRIENIPVSWKNKFAYTKLNAGTKVAGSE